MLEIYCAQQKQKWEVMAYRSNLEKFFLLFCSYVSMPEKHC